MIVRCNSTVTYIAICARIKERWVSDFLHEMRGETGDRSIGLHLSISDTS